LVDLLATLATQVSLTSNCVYFGKVLDEYGTIIEEIDRQAAVAYVDAAADFSVFVSSETTVADGVISGSIGAADSTTLGLTATSFTTAAEAQDALAEVTAAIDTLGDVQNSVGTLQNRLTFAISLAQSQIVNTRAAESRIRDANIAEESANMTRFNILSQSGIASLAQANQSSAAVLALLR